MFHIGFYGFFLVIGFVLGFVVLMFGVIAINFLSKHKYKALDVLTLEEFRKRIPSIKTKKEALELIDEFCRLFGIFAPKLNKKQEWLEAIRDITALEVIDTDEAAQVRERLSAINPNVKKDIEDYIGMALKNKKK